MNEIVSSFEYTKVPNFLDDLSTETTAIYMQNIVHRGFYLGESSEGVRSAYQMYADPLAEILLEKMRPRVEEVVGKRLYPTYSFFRVYVKGDILEKHIDRPSCEYSVTVNIANEGGLWPIYMESNEGVVSSFMLNPGDAVIYKGCEIPHWRKSEESTVATGQLMFHYVDRDGEFSSYKFDKRPGLGFQRN
jgi:hypothetical protein